jgi:cytochrome c-type biogenesis protein CcmH/NrfG
MQRTLVPTQPSVRDISLKLLIGGTMAVGVVLALCYFSLAHFFAVNARAKDGLAKRSRKAEKDRDPERATLTAKKRGAGA